MPSTHCSLHYHIVFSTKDRAPLLSAENCVRLHAWLGGALRGMEGMPHAVGGVSDHVHLLTGLNPTHRLSDVMRELKAESSKWIQRVLGLSAFRWQEGYGAFTVSAGNLETAREYVLGQESHHRGTSFQEEYVRLLDKGLVTYDDRYLW